MGAAYPATELQCRGASAGKDRFHGYRPRPARSERALWKRRTPGRNQCPRCLRAGFGQQQPCARARSPMGLLYDGWKPASLYRRPLQSEGQHGQLVRRLPVDRQRRRNLLGRLLPGQKRRAQGPTDRSVLCGSSGSARRRAYPRLRRCDLDR